jgi:hypothetical protein
VKIKQTPAIRAGAAATKASPAMTTRRPRTTLTAVPQPEQSAPEQPEQPQPEQSAPEQSAPAQPAPKPAPLKQQVTARLIKLVADNLDDLCADVDRDAAVAYLSNTLSYLAGVQQHKTEWDDRLAPITSLSH